MQRRDDSQCPKCARPFMMQGLREPRVMPCGHTVCRKCVETSFIQSSDLICFQCLSVTRWQFLKDLRQTEATAKFIAENKQEARRERKEGEEQGKTKCLYRGCGKMGSSKFCSSACFELFQEMRTVVMRCS